MSRLKFLSYYQLIFCCTDMPHLFIHSLVGFVLFQLFGSCESRSFEHSCTSFVCGQRFSFLIGLYLEVELLGHRVTLCHTVSWKQPHHFTFPRAGSEEAALVISPQPTLVLTYLVSSSQPRVEWHPTGVLMRLSLLTEDVMNLLIGHVSFLWKKMTTQTHCSFWNWIIFIFSLTSKSFSHMLDTSPYWICKHFLSFCKLSFHFLDGILWSYKGYFLHPSYLFFFCCLWFGVLSKVLPNPKQWRPTPLFVKRFNSYL